MKKAITKSDSSQPVAETAVYLFDDWFDPIEAGVRDRVRDFIQAMIEGELGGHCSGRAMGGARDRRAVTMAAWWLSAVTGTGIGHDR